MFDENLESFYDHKTIFAITKQSFYLLTHTHARKNYFNLSFQNIITIFSFKFKLQIFFFLLHFFLLSFDAAAAAAVFGYFFLFLLFLLRKLQNINRNKFLSKNATQKNIKCHTIKKCVSHLR